ncbi:beta-glucoside kinase [Lachnospiraceae bacterium]|nr:beta-glucoside kinase [Lachnospiraceae bacterium]
MPGDPFSGCYERYASTTALVNKAKELDPGLDNGRKIFARIDEPKVRAVVEQWAEEIAYGLVTLVCIFNPSCIILGGGVMAQPYILERVEEKVRKQIMPSFGGLKLRQATLGNQAGLLGAAWLGSQKLQGFSQKGRNEP